MKAYIIIVSLTKWFTKCVVFSVFIGNVFISFQSMFLMLCLVDDYPYRFYFMNHIILVSPACIVHMVMEQEKVSGLFI